MSEAARLSRRTFLTGLLATTGAVLASACGLASPSVPSASQAAPSPSPTPSPTPTPQPTPEPSPEPSLAAKIGQLLLVGFRGTTPQTAGQALADIGERGLGGVLLFDRDQPTGSPVRNIVSPGQLAGLTGALRAASAGSGPALLVAIDQEGGRVARLRPEMGFPATQSAAALGALDDPAATREAGVAIAETLAAVGINWNLAPVVDLNLNPANPIIGALDRSFGDDPDRVIEQAGAFVEGHRSVRVLTALKHFPGHGSSTGDTHLGVVDVTDTWARVELRPFGGLIDRGLADAVLTAHVFNARLDRRYPATLSRATIHGLLRGELGHEGLVISDDMQMGAIRDAFGYEEALELALNAGVDMLTIANQQVFEEGIVERTVGLIEGLVEGGRVSEARIDEAWRRVVAFKERLA